MCSEFGTDSATVNVFVARQPIFDRDQTVHAYELLFRSGLQNYYDSLEPDKATVDVISNSFFIIGFDQLTDGKRGFINFTRDLLLKGVPLLVPPEVVTIEIMEDIKPDEHVLGTCRELKQLGYKLAMDDFVLDHRGSPLIEHADIVKVDFLGTEPEDRRRICEELTDRGVEVLAEKVETVDDFQQALDWGYSLFQGYFFSKPVIQTGKHISGNKLAYLQVLNEINQPGISYDDLEAAIKQDVSLTYKLMRFMNSAWFGLRYEVVSIKHALVLLGPKEIRKWFALVGLSHIASEKPQELILRAIARAKAAELLGPNVGMGEYCSELFLMGMFSLIDALTDSPMSEVLERLPLKIDVKKALLGEMCPFRTVHDTIVSYERGEWDVFSQSADHLRLDENVMPGLYRQSLRWANDAFAIL